MSCIWSIWQCVLCLPLFLFLHTHEHIHSVAFNISHLNVFIGVVVKLCFFVLYFSIAIILSIDSYFGLCRCYVLYPLARTPSSHTVFQPIFIYAFIFVFVTWIMSIHTSQFHNANTYSHHFHCIVVQNSTSNMACRTAYSVRDRVQLLRHVFTIEYIQ